MATRRRSTARTLDAERSAAPALALFLTGAVSMALVAWRVDPFAASADAALGVAGALALSIVLMVAGALSLVGVRGGIWVRVACGLILALVALLGWGGMAAAAGAAGVALSGGLVGALGTPVTHLVFALCALVGAALALEDPFFTWLHSCPERRPAPPPRSRKRAAEESHRPAERKAAPRPPRPERTVHPAIEDGFVDPPDRAVVRARELPALPVEEKRPPALSTPAILRRWAARSESEPPAQTSFPTLDHETRPDGGAFKLPPISLLSPPPPVSAKAAQQDLAAKIRILEETLDQFGIPANVVEIARGPTVTRYEIQLAPGIKVSKIVSLADNLAMSLAAIDVRLEAPIPGKSAIGVEVPNASAAVVALRECIDCPEFWNAPGKLTFVLGKDVSGANRYADLACMPHLLIGGSTNSGKSVCLNALIASIVYRATPSEVKMLLIDPKRVELSLWDGIPHLMHPVVRDVKQAAGIFRAALKEMDRRYELLSRLGTRNIDGYNKRVTEAERIPYVVLVVDELADLMMQCAAEVETSICRLAQLARATGIHLVIATQRPSVNVITGTIKANIPSRIAFAATSQVDSRTILDGAGAERLVGRGDMLFRPIDAHKPLRVQGAYLSEAETLAIVSHLKEQDRPTYTMTPVDVSMGTGGPDEPGGDVEDDLFETAVRLIVSNGQASTSMLQRRFKIGYNRAARLLDMMEARSIVSPLDGAKPRDVLINRDEVERMFERAR